MREAVDELEEEKAREDFRERFCPDARLRRGSSEKLWCPWWVWATRGPTYRHRTLC